MRNVLVGGMLGLGAVVLGTAAPAWAGGMTQAGGVTQRVSVGPGGAGGNGNSFACSISANGRFVSFDSDASNLVAGDTNDASDAFVRDRATGTTRRVSLGIGGAQANGFSNSPMLSADGRHVAFDSVATNLVPGDTNGWADAFVRDLRTGRTERVSVGPGGRQADAQVAGTNISPDGRYVVFVSSASNLVRGDTNGLDDVFLHDRRTRRTERVSLGPRGAQSDGLQIFAPVVSAGGRYVAFSSDATNLVPGDTNGWPDVFVRDRRAGRTRRVSVGPGGREADSGSDAPSLSADGRVVAFRSDATNLVPGGTDSNVHVYVRDLRAGTTEIASRGPGGVLGNGISVSPGVSPGGRYVAFVSVADNLVPGDTNEARDVFVRDRRRGTTRRVSVARDGAQANGPSDSFSAVPISARGRVVAFFSEATNLVPGDANGAVDVFARVQRRGR